MGLLALLCSLCTGCATILSGSSQEVSFRSDPQQAAFVVVGGTVGKYMITASKTSDTAQKLRTVLAPHLDRETTEFLRQFTLEELISYLVIYANPGQLAAAIPDDVTAVLNTLPKSILKTALGQIGIETFGVTPTTEALDTDSSYIVLGYLDGRKVDTFVIETERNGYVFLNVLTLGLGLIVDLISGAWCELDTDTVQLTLPAQPAPSAKP